MKEISQLSLKELAVFVSHHLRQHGIENVLTGGACVSIYSENKYQSSDLDFVNIEESPFAGIKTALEKIGFKETGRIFINENVSFSVDILNPPLSVGEHYIERVNTIEIDNMTLRLLTPTDSVKDRLAAFYFWNDRQALELFKPIETRNIARYTCRQKKSRGRLIMVSLNDSKTAM